MNLSKKITQWQNAGLISAEQGRKINVWEQQNNKPYLFYGLIALSLFCIGLGIISVIAANWDTIPAVIKLGFALLLLSGCACLTYMAYLKQKQAWFDGSIFLFALSVLGVIGLTAQVYQLQPDGYTAYLLWSILIFPLLFFVKSALLPLIWIPVMWGSFWSYIIDHEIAAKTLEIITNSWDYAIPILWLALWIIFYQLLDKYVGKYAAGIKKALVFWLAFYIVVTIFMIDRDYGTALLNHNHHGLQHADNGIRISFIVLSACLCALSFRLGGKKFIWPFLLAVMIAGSLLPLGFVISLTALAGAGFYAYKTNRPRLLNFILVLAGIRIFIIYIDIFGSLMQTGLGLILSGFILLGLIFGWLKLSVIFKERLHHEK